MANHNGDTHKENKTPDIEQIFEDLEKRKQLADVERTTLEAEKALLDMKTEVFKSELERLVANLPESNITPPAGKVTIEDKGINNFAKLVPYAVMQRCASKAVLGIDSKLESEPEDRAKRKVLIVDDLKVALGEYPRLLVNAQFDAFEEALRSKFELIEDLLIDLEPTPRQEHITVPLTTALVTASTALSVAPKLLDAAARLLSYFKVNYNISSIEVSISNETLSANVAGRIKEGSVQIMDFRLVENSAVFNRFAKLLSLRFNLIDNLMKLTGNLNRVQDTKREVAERTVGDSNKLIEEFDAVTTLLLTMANEEDPPLLLQAAIRQHIHDAEIKYLLYLNVESSGSDLITKEKIWTFGGEMAVLGGVAISYILADTDGKIMASDTILMASEFRRDIGTGKLFDHIDLPLQPETKPAGDLGEAKEQIVAELVRPGGIDEAVAIHAVNNIDASVIENVNIANFSNRSTWERVKAATRLVTKKATQ